MSPGSTFKDSSELPSIYDTVRLHGSQIRVLSLLPGRDLDPVRCTMQSVDNLASEFQGTSENDAPQSTYDALSYVWASDEEDGFILVNDTRFKVSANLNHALNCIRLPDAVRTVWVDAICINQNDTREKSEQVAIMDQIYSKAKAVLIYLGPESDDSALVMDYLTVDDSELSDCDGELFTMAGARMLRAEGNPLRLSVESERVFLESYFNRKGIETKRMMQAAYNFFCRPWWSRMWVIQEAKLAKQEPQWFCGRHSTTMQRLRERLVALHNLALIKLQPALISLQEAQAIGPRGRRKPFEDLMAWTRGVEFLFFTLDPEYAVQSLQTLSMWMDRCTTRYSTDPRDRIYAILSLLGPLPRLLLRPDYSKPSEEIFTEATRYILGFENDTRVFSLYSLNRTDRYPSWSLDFTKPFPQDVGTWLEQYHSSYWVSKEGHLDMDDTALTLLGIEFDVIKTVNNVEESAYNIEILRAIGERGHMVNSFQDLIVHQKVKPPADISSSFLLPPQNPQAKEAEDWIHKIHGLDQDYMEMLQSLVHSRDELPGSVSFGCNVLKAMTALVADFQDDARCQNFELSLSKRLHHRACLRMCMSTMTRDFIYAATFNLSELQSMIEKIRLSQETNEANTSDPTSFEATATSDSLCDQLEAALLTAQCQQDLERMKTLAQDMAGLCHTAVVDHTNNGICSPEIDAEETIESFTAEYAKARAALDKVLSECRCTGSDRQAAHSAELEARRHEMTQEILMLEHLVRFFKMRRTSEYYTIELLAVERSRYSAFLTTGLFLGFCFQPGVDLREGDRVVLVNGVVPPIIMRKVHGSRRFKMMGISYVIGISDVDLESLVEDEVFEEEEFKIV